MKKQKGFLEVVVSGIMLLVICLGMLAMMKWECTSKWEQSGLPVQWGPIKGCLVQVPTGRWLPAETIRELDIKVEPQLKPNAQKDQG